MAGIDIQKLGELVRSSFLADPGGFKPTAIHEPNLDMMTFLLKDCSFCEDPIPDIGISLLRKRYGEDAGKIVGIQINCWSHWRKNL
jgi:hypothetical protein